MTHRTPLALAAALAAVTVVVGPAAAIDDKKPEVSCYGNFFTDKAGDAKSNGPASAQANGNQDTPNLDLLSAFWKYDKDKGEEATTINIVVKNLNTDIPPGATSIAWMMRYGGSDGTEHWVRAATDFSGVVTYTYGNLTDAGATSFSTRQGDTPGAFFEGENGVVQLVIPTANGDGKPGFTIKAATVYGYEANSPIPQAAPTPIKGGFLYEDDTAPGKGGYTVGSACPAAAPAGPLPVTGPSGVKPIQSAEKPLPVKLLTKKAKAGKKLSLKLRSSEPLTQLAAQVVKGRTVVAKGKLAKLDGNATMKLKVSKKLKKGSYRVDLVGSDASGARRFVQAKLAVR
jgi:hypothetical protein